MTQFIKKFIGEIALTIGVTLSSYGIFSFSHTGGTGGEYIEGLSELELPPFSGRYEYEYVTYYYNHNIILLITAGVLLITLGVLIIKNRKN